MSGSEVIFEGRRLRAEMWYEGQDKLAVTLDFRRSKRADGFAPVPRVACFREAGFAQLALRTRANDWFINADTKALGAALRRAVRGFVDVRALGYSMGGYGAFRFARSIGLDTVIAVSPQVSIHPEVAPFDSRYLREAQRFGPALGDLSRRISPGLGGLVLADPGVPEDLAHARALQALYPRLRLVAMPGAGHPASALLAESRQARLLHRLLVAERISPGPILEAHKAARGGSPGYWTRMARRAETRRPDWAATAAARARLLQAQAG